MKYQRHGLAIIIERTERNFFVAFKAQGELIHEDYQTITPMLDSALVEVRQPKVRAFVDITGLRKGRRLAPVQAERSGHRMVSPRRGRDNAG